jgi:hypothetical protein
MSEEIRRLLAERADGGRISCEEAWQVADELGVPKTEVGAAADDLGIRITDCQLGCFK